MEKRIKILAVIFSVIMIGLGIRAWYIQVEGHDELKEAAALQQTLKITGADERGIIYDRNGARLTDIKKEYVYIIMRKKVDMSCRNLLKAIKAAEGDRSNDMYAIYRTEKNSLHIREKLETEYDAYVIEAAARYSSRQPAVHAIGYTKGNKGAAGIEKKYEKRLYSSSNGMYVYTDGEGRILKGLDPFVSYGEEAFVTTIDIGLQKQVEKILEKSPFHSGAVVTSSQSGDILAMASSPSYNPLDMEEYLDEENGCLMNRCINAYPPGSVFKIAVAAAYLEGGGSIEDRYVCRGYEKRGSVRVKCSECHGDISLKEAFAYSCNSCFIEIGSRLGYEEIRDMAFDMKMGNTILGFEGESSGKIMSEDEAKGGLINMSIGQGSMLVTPIQVAAMTNIIAAGGQYIEPGFTDEQRKIKKVISAETAKTVKKMMRAAALYGTADSTSCKECCGKTGSAEAYPFVHGWFTGFFPYEKPEYTITVICENGGSGRESALVIFDQIAEELR